jgi:hypothetical protein
MAGKRVPLGHKNRGEAARAYGAVPDHSARKHYQNRSNYAQTHPHHPALRARPSTAPSGMLTYSNRGAILQHRNPVS